MKNLLFVLAMYCFSCTPQKKASEGMAPERNDTLHNPVLRSVPECVQDLITKFTAEKMQNPPRRIYAYTYKDQTVYYVPAICCDFYSDLYDGNCTLIGHPDGGITGRGDGKLPDFAKERSDEIVIWEDERK